MNSSEKSRIGIDEVISRMKEVADVTSVAALSRALGHRSNAIGNTISRGNIPYKEAVTLAQNKSVSLDWLILGKQPPAAPLPGLDSQGGYVADSPVSRNGDETLWVAPALAVLREIVEGVEAALAQMSTTLGPSKKAELIATLYEIYASAQARPSPGHILRLVRSAS